MKFVNCSFIIYPYSPYRIDWNFLMGGVGVLGKNPFYGEVWVFSGFVYNFHTIFQLKFNDFHAV